MSIQVQLPAIEPEAYAVPRCPHCEGAYVKAHGQKSYDKTVRDVHHETVWSYRLKCMRCQRTFRYYPVGVSQATQSHTLQGMRVLLYVLGLSYGAVSDFLGALGIFISKTTVYRNVQAAGIAARQQGRSTEQCAVIGADGTYLKLKGQKVGLQVVVNDASGELLGLEIVSSENTDDLLELVAEIAQAVGAEVLVSDDLDTYKEVADELTLDHQICRKHVKDNVDDLVDELVSQLQRAEDAPEETDLSSEILVMDLALIQGLVWTRPPDAQQHLAQLYQHYKAVPCPPSGYKHTVW